MPSILSIKLGGVVISSTAAPVAKDQGSNPLDGNKLDMNG